MTEHSPGPFGSSATLSSDLYNIRYIYDAEGNCLATVRQPKDMSQEEALANAALFKAAPKLLAALKGILLWDDGNLPGDMMDAGAAAVAEAEGEK